MIQKAMDVLTAYPIRKSKKQKQSFRDDVQAYVKTLGYESVVEKGFLGSRNVVIGNPEKAKYLITAHYDTCARLPFPNLITPCSLLPFALYQLLLIILIFGAAFLVGLAATILTMDSKVGGTIWYLCIWMFLILMLFGPANKHNANDNTSGVVTVLEIAKSMPTAYRSQVCFVLFDLEEAGLIGSASHRGKHKEAAKDQIVLNLDCVGDGDEIVFFPTKNLRKDPKRMAPLRRCVGSWGSKSIAIREKGFSYYPSDQANFPLGVGIAALHRSKWAGLYLGRIHTHKDTILEETNVNILRACLISLICGPAAE